MIKCTFEAGNLADPGLRHIVVCVLVQQEGRLLLARRGEGLQETGRQNVDFVHMADAVRRVGEHDHETAALEWFDLDALPGREQIAFDHADNLELYREFMRKPFALPVLYNR